MTEATDEVKVQAARARWRSDLLTCHAAELRRLAGGDPSPTAQGLLKDADAKEAEATVHVDHAEAAERLSAAKRDYFDNPKDEDIVARYQRASQAMVDLRSYWRGIGELSGTRRGVLTVDDFPEPTDEDVLATYGGEN
jgi:hypothetical protein